MNYQELLQGIEVNYNPEPQDFAPFILEKLEEFYYKISTNKKIPYNTIEDLKKIILRFPNVPGFKNYLANAYLNNDKLDFHINILNEMIQKHPDYIFGYLQLSNYFLNDENVEKAEYYLKNTRDIREFSPEKKKFHIQEIAAFYQAWFMVELEKDSIEEAQQIISFLQELKISPLLIEDLQERLFNKKFDTILSEIPTKNENLIEPNESILDIQENAIEPPILSNKVLYELYTSELFLPDQVIKTILTLERGSLLQDLMLILKDARNRFHYFDSLAEDDYSSVVVHTLLILMELKAHEVFEEVLEFLKYNEDFIEFWFSDFLTEDLWMIIFQLGKDKLPEIQQYLKLPGIYAFSKIAVADGLHQIYQQIPEKREEIENIWLDSLQYFNTLTKEDNVISSIFFSSIVTFLMTINSDLYEKEIKEMYNKNWIDHSICGSLESLSVERNFYKNERKLLSIKEVYAGFQKYWESVETQNQFPNSFFNLNDDNEKDRDIQHQPAISNKIGRNEPCLCGSGKKYKKCCL